MVSSLADNVRAFAIRLEARVRCLGKLRDYAEKCLGAGLHGRLTLLYEEIDKIDEICGELSDLLSFHIVCYSLRDSKLDLLTTRSVLNGYQMCSVVRVLSAASGGRTA